MRLVTFDDGDGARLGVVAGDAIVDLAGVDLGCPPRLRAVLERWPVARVRIARALHRGRRLPVTGVRLVLPLSPRRILGTGGNYADHLAEMRAQAPVAPSAFQKLPGTELASGEPVALADEERFVDYEGEIALVMGATARDVATEQALEAVAGVMLANDISHRDVSMAHAVLAKSSRGFCPLGPCLVTLDELDLADISFAVAVNGEPRQTGHTGSLIHSFADLVSSYSHALPLHAGDVILTGTPAGVGVGMKPPRFLRPGDEVVVASPQLGVLRTPVVARDGA